MRHGIVLSHEVRGAGEPVVVLNGGMMSWGAWAPISEPLSRRFRVVLCDFRGQLRTPGPPPVRFADHADDVAALLAHLDIASAHVFGTSFGAEVAVVLAAGHPGRVRSLTLVAATDRFTPGMADAGGDLQVACREALAGGDRGRLFDAISAFAYTPRWRERHREELAARRAFVARLPDSWFEGLIGLLGSLDGLDLTPWLPRVSCPTHVVAAGCDGAMPLERTTALARGIPGARLTVVPGAGHAVVAEDPGAILRIFLADRELPTATCGGKTPYSSVRMVPDPANT